ncbi:MAG TPA: protein kinase [Bryobacteraceae bacterium]|nr:protein kinase [Bryobacteraceae bacterium]
MNSPLRLDVEAAFAAALELPPSEQAAFLAREYGHNPSLCGEVESLLRAHRAAANFLEPGVAGPSRIGPYRIVDHLGAGGMGSVFRAERDDEQFRQQVAIKMISGSLAGRPEFVRRFLDERQILAGLAHPNIARLLDGGYLPSGAPYLVMEYVDGVPITIYCNEHDLAGEARLRLFLELCDAVQFAHQHLVVHRDLKPGNVLVTSDGTPKLLDFGIAKLLAADQDRTGTIAQVVTLDYASPEQVRGAPVTTASDVYSLGVLLYELLAKERAYSLSGQSLEQAVDYICTRDPAPPGAVANCRVSQDLDAIVMKAMRKEPRERYGSAAELSADIGRYLDGRPVRARRGTLRYVARKFIVRHRTAVAAAIAAVSLLVASGVALVHSARVAEAERAKAQQRFDQVRQLANSLLFELNESVGRLPGSTSVRKQLTARALQYLDALAKTSSGDPGLQLDLAQSYERLGSIQGHISEMNLGDPQSALASYRRGIEILERVQGDAHATGHNDVLKELGYLHLLRGDVYRDLRDFQGRDREYEQGIKIIEPLATRFPNDEALSRLYSIALFGLAKGRAAENPDAARALYLRTLAIDGRLLQSHPDDQRYQRNLALGHKYLASVLRSHPEALAHLRMAQALDEKRVAADPKSPGARLDLSFDLSEIASHVEATGDLSRALELCRQAQSIRKELAAADPQNAQFRLRVATAGKSLGGMLAKMGRLDEALGEYRASAGVAEAAIRAVPADPRNRETLGELEMGIASTEERIATRSAGGPGTREHLQKSCRAYARAAEVLTALAREGIATEVETGLAKDAARAAAACSR